MIDREIRSGEGVLALRERDWEVMLCSNSIYKMPVPAMRKPPADMVVASSTFTTGKRVKVLSMRQPTTHDMTSHLFCRQN